MSFDGITNMLLSTEDSKLSWCLGEKKNIVSVLLGDVMHSCDGAWAAISYTEDTYN